MLLLKVTQLIFIFLTTLLTTVTVFAPEKSNAQTATTSASIQSESIIQALQKGGYIIYFRHTQTNPNQADTDTLHLENIKAQRQLTEVGKEQARQIGRVFQKWKIPVGKVLTSRLYRAQEVAKLAGFQNYQALVDVTEPQNVPPVEIQRRAAALRQLLATQPQQGTNTVIIAHRPNLQDAAGKEFGDLKEGEAAIFKPLGNQGFQLIGRVASPEQWTDLASSFSPPQASK
jgi:phosphohistidine phosphatase SixA